jgi:ABC-2 type transport system permease protein
MLSGFIFPISSMPAFLQGVTHVVPARYFLVILRGLLLKGVDLALLWVDVVSLAVFSLVVLMLASLRLKREWA